MVLTISDLVDTAIAVLPVQKSQLMKQNFALDGAENASMITRAEIEHMVRAIGARKGILDAPWEAITKRVIAKMPIAAQQELVRWGTTHMGREDIAWMAACVSMELRKIVTKSYSYENTQET